MPKPSDADLIATLVAVEREGSGTAAARVLRMNPRTVNDRIAQAKSRGLTTGSKTAEPAHLRTRVAQLERELRHAMQEQDTAASLRERLYGLASVPADPPKWLYRASKPGAPGVPMTLWSDWHYGETVRPAEVGGVNAYNRRIAQARIQRLLDATLDLTLNHMVEPSYPGIVVCLGGDMISGSIHDELRETNDGYLQETLFEVRDQLVAALTLMAEKFERVFVPCVVGNHGRSTLRPRAKGRVFESFEWNLYCQIERHFRDDPRVHVHVPSETDAYFSVNGHRFLLTHGDTLGVKGGDGIIGALGPIARGTFKVGRSEAQIGRDFDTLLMGHWHTFIPRGDAVPAIVNGSLIGYNEYARLGLRVPYSRPSQALWFVHRRYGITAQWQIYLDEARTARDGNAWVRVLAPKGKKT